MEFLLFFGLIILLVLLSFVCILGGTLGLGWLLTLFLPFSLFEATLLSLFTSVLVATIWRPLIRLFADVDFDNLQKDILKIKREASDTSEVDRIPATKFYQKEEDQNWENWLRYEFANDIYAEFQDAPQRVTPMNKSQLQSLAIRLADVSLAILKAKTTRAKDLNINRATLKRQFTKMGQHPYDDDILDLATTAINDNIDYYYDDLLEVIQQKNWEATSDYWFS